MIRVRSGRAADPLVMAGIAAGVALRLVTYIQARPLWLDEAALALNIASRGTLQLLEPLDFGQGAPPLYLLLTKLSASALGVNALSLRLPALVAGLALVFVTPAIAKRLGGGRSTVMATWFVAMSPLLVYYSNEVKQYGVEALAGALLILAALPVISGDAGPRQRLVLTLGGALTIWISLTAAFALAAIGAVLLHDLVRRRAKHQRWIIITGITWAASIGAAYLLSYRFISHDPFMRAYWQSTYLPGDVQQVLARMPLVIGGLPSATFFHRDLFDLLPDPIRLLATGALLAVIGYGTIRLAAAHDGRFAVLLLGPLAIVFIAYLGRQYPFTARLLAFAAPALAILAGIGLSVLTARTSARLAALVTVLALVPPAWHAGLEIREPSRSHLSGRSVVDSLGVYRKPSEPVFVFVKVLKEWTWLTTDWRNPDLERIRNAARVWRAESTGDGRGRAAEMHYRTPPYNEVYGTSSGIPVEFAPSSVHAVRPGWGPEQAARLRAAAAPCVWTFTGGMTSREFESLFEGLSAAGGSLQRLIRDRDFAVRHICFPADAGYGAPSSDR